MCNLISLMSRIFFFSYLVFLAGGKIKKKVFSYKLTPD